MTELRLLKYPNPLLMMKCAQVAKEELPTLHDEAMSMLCACVAWKGYALAAPQVGIMKQFFVVPPHNGLGQCPMVIINPQILDSAGEYRYNESCLSMPGVTATLKRPNSIHIWYQDLAGQSQDFHCNGVLARVLFHEIDHLDGKLFHERLDTVQRARVGKQLAKFRPARAA